jgi:ubiquinone/menaquinone biosynthesis C-methylase UbiE/DNA-binding transcriptional MerR regulator
MKKGEGEFLTTGQLAKRTGMTLRTLRYYDQIGLLKPSQYKNDSSRLYSKEDLILLQKIQTLKYIGLSLQEIHSHLHDASIPKPDLQHSLSMQKDLIQKKVVHMRFVVKAIEEALGLLRPENNDVDWSSLIDIIQTIHTEMDWGQQYLNGVRLQARIQLYDTFSINPLGWHRWFFEQLVKGHHLKILELGCGNAALWCRNKERIPESWSITLTDVSSGMLEEARINLEDLRARFQFLVADAQSIPFHDQEYDIVIANHMLYHVPDIPQAVSEMYRILKPNGLLYVSTMSKQHLQEFEEIAHSFDPKLRVMDPVMERFHLDNGEGILSEWFKEVSLIRYEDHMLVTETQPLIDYMTSTPMNAREHLVGSTLNKFRAFLMEKIDREGSIYITKDSGFFLARKTILT